MVRTLYNSSGNKHWYNIRLTTRALQYGYSNARVYGMMGLFLSKTDMEELIRVKTIAGMFELLQRSSYKDDLSGLTPTDASSIELGTIRHFSRICRKIISFTPKQDVPALKALLRRWVFLNLDIILNAKRLNLGFDEIKNQLYDLPQLRLSDARKLYELSPEGFEDAIKYYFMDESCILNKGSSCRQSISASKKKAINELLKDISDPYERIKLRLDMSRFNFLLDPIFDSSRELKKIKNSLLKEVDARNLLLILRLKKRSVPPQTILNLLYPIGTLSKSILKNYVNLSYNDLINVIKVLYKDLKIDENTKLSKIELMIQNYTSAEKVRMFHSSVLSIGPILQFFMLKEQEMFNIQRIAKAKMLGIPEEELKENLIFIK